MMRIIFVIVGSFFISLAAFAPFFILHNSTRLASDTKTAPTLTPKSTSNPISLPESYIIPQHKHLWQSFNNCGPATLSMILSYYGVDVSQEELGQQLRPYQIPGGNNDDKSVTLREVAEEAKKYNLIPYLRPNGTIEKLKAFIALDLPVIARTWLTTGEDIGHYRVIRGFDDTTETITQDDSLQAGNSIYTYEELLELWKPFNYEYLVLVPSEKIKAVEQILGEEIDEKVAWANSLLRIQQELATDPQNVHLLFNLSINYYYIGDYQKSIEAYEGVRDRLTMRRLWYQIEPILSYYEVGDYNTVFAISKQILNNHNRAYSELYILRGNIYKSSGNKDLARVEYEKAVFYNENSLIARENLASL